MITGSQVPLDQKSHSAGAFFCIAAGRCSRNDSSRDGTSRPPGDGSPTPLLLCLAASSMALAQNPGLPGSGAPASPVAARPSGGTARLQFPNTDVKDVLNFYASLTNKRVVVDNQVQGNVYIVVTGDVT